MTWEAVSSGKRGRQPDDSDAAILTCLTMKVLFGLALRQIEPCCATGSSELAKGDQGRGGRRVERLQARRLETQGFAQGPHRVEEGQKTAQWTVFPTIGCIASSC